MNRRIPTFCVVLIACLGIANAVSGQTITDLFNTGVNSSNTALGLGVHDPHYINLADGTAPYTYADKAWTSNPASN